MNHFPSRPSSRRPSRGFRPAVEALEGREVPATFLVTTTANEGAGSLRQAILDANGHANVGGVADRINFNIGGPSTQIAVTAALPAVTEAVVIDATTQPGAGGTPVVQLDGLGGTGIGLFLSNHAGSTVKGLVFSRFVGPGVFIVGGGGHTVVGNFIGTSQAGTSAFGNTGDGVEVENSHDNLIVGDTISGNGGAGVLISGAKSVRNVVRDCNIGTDRFGVIAVGNGGDGVLSTDDASFTQVIHCIVSANGLDGIDIEGDHNTVQGNLVGLDRTGAAALGNRFDGVHVFGGGNLVGGPKLADRNVIAGNGDDGVSLSNFSGALAGNVAQNNLIGTDAHGIVALPNAGDGVIVFSANNLVVGNVISGNAKNGVLIDDDDTAGTLIRGNLIGLDATGTRALGNGEDGVHIQSGASGVQVGGPLAAHRNVISGNGDDGVQIEESDGNVVRGNFIGTDKTGLKKLGNNFGVFLDGSGENVLLGNVISGNKSQGVLIEGGILPSLRNRVQNNLIGVGADGKTALGNGEQGVFIQGALNLIGGNVIAHNGDEGVQVSKSQDVGNTITANLIFANGKRGIELGAVGADPIDPLDGDAGANGLQNAPLITSAVASAGRTTIRGVLLSTPSAKFRVEFFANDGGTFLGSAVVTTGAGGKANFQFVVNHALAAGRLVTATATRLATGDTSEFAASRSVQALGGAVKGVVFNDRNGNGTHQAGEGGLGGVLVFADLNGNGKRDKVEPAAVTAANGFFQLFLAQDATFAVREATPTGFKRTTPVPLVSVTGGKAVGGVLIGNRLL